MRNKVSFEKVCEWCNTPFTAYKISTRFCSHRCASLAYKDEKRTSTMLAFKQKQEREKDEDLNSMEYLTPSNLEWENIIEDDNIGTCIRLRTQKTQTEATLPISEEALTLCGERTQGKVFKGLSRSMIGKPLKPWLKIIGITKRITFHCLRHTFATLQVAAGTDIYTVSKLLTHKNVTTTQIYADLVSSAKREAVNRLSLKKKSK